MVTFGMNALDAFGYQGKTWPPRGLRTMEAEEGIGR